MPPSLPRPCRSCASAAFAVSLLLAAITGRLHGHDTFLRADDHEVGVGDAVEVFVFHGTFDESVLMLGRDMVHGILLSAPAGVRDLGYADWSEMGHPGRPWAKWQAVRRYFGAIDRRLTSRFQVNLESEGTHIIGLQLNPGGAAMSPQTFLNYLHEVGLEEEPVAETSFPDSNAIITERYRKYTKILIQAGRARSPNASQPIGHEVEIVPLVHPSDVRPGGGLGVQLLFKHQPLPGQVLLAGRPARALGRDPFPRQRLRSDSQGRVEVPIDRAGVWWLSFVHLVPAPPGDEVAYDSQWATLTLEIR